MKIIKTQRGFSLVELMIVVGIMVIISTAVLRITMHTAFVMVTNAQQTIAETGGRNILARMAEDIRMAGQRTGGAGGAGPFWDASGGDQIYITKYGRNLDAFSVPNNGDMLDDVACYRYQAPSGVRGDDGYIPGRILAGTDNGDSMCVNMVQLSDVSVDVIGFEIKYCRPATGVAGSFNCTTILDQPGTMTTNSTCVWLVKLSISTRRLAKYGHGETATPAIVNYNTTVKPRNLYFAALRTDVEKNDLVDCCDALHVGADVSWCPPPKRN